MKLTTQIFKVIPKGKTKDKIRNYSLYFLSYLTFRKEVFDFGKFYRTPFKDIDLEPEIIEGYMKEYSLKKGDTVIDVGAFHGIFTIYASKLVGDTGKVYAFEPDWLSFRMLKKNIELNKLNNVIAVNKGLWKSNCEMGFRSFLGNSRIFEYDENQIITNNISVIRFDDFVKENNLTVDFIKMDIEGAELEALSGMEELIKNQDTKFAIASYHEVNGEKTYYKLESFFRNRNYKSFTGFPEHITTYALKNELSN